jgi:hypothetical protein
MLRPYLKNLVLKFVNYPCVKAVELRNYSCAMGVAHRTGTHLYITSAICQPVELDQSIVNFFTNKIFFSKVR